MSNTDAAQTELELERLREENERLRRALSDRQQLATTNPPSPQSLINDQSFIEDLSRFAEGVLTEKQVRQKWHLLAEADWERFGKDDAFVERIELERTRRIRSGATKRELAQNHIVKGPSILNEIMSDPKQSARHRVDSIKALDAIADPGSQASHDEMDRVIVTINLGGDEKLTFGGTVKPNSNNTDAVDVNANTEIIDVTPVDEPLPIKRGRGRPPGSRNKPKNDPDDAPPLPGFAT